MDTSVINNPQLLVTVSDPTMLTKLKNAIKMLNGFEAKEDRTGISRRGQGKRQSYPLEFRRRNV